MKAGAGGLSQAAQERGAGDYLADVAGYLKRLYDRGRQRFAYREGYPGGFRKWRQEVRDELRRQLGMEIITASAGRHRPVVELGEAAGIGRYTRHRGLIETEPEVCIPSWLLLTSKL